MAPNGGYVLDRAAGRSTAALYSQCLFALSRRFLSVSVVVTRSKQS